MKFTRREILTTFLGAPLALAACRSELSRTFPDGEIVGQSVDLGHILRANQNFDVPADNWQTINTAIIGGGIAGLTAAWKFKRENFNDFVLLELEKEVGGTARSGKGEPVPYPWGAHYLPVPFQENGDLITFLNEMDLFDGRGSDGELSITSAAIEQVHLIEKSY